MAMGLLSLILPLGEISVTKLQLEKKTVLNVPRCFTRGITNP